MNSMTAISILKQFNILTDRGALNNNYVKIVNSLSADQRELINAEYPEYEELGYKLKAIINGDYKRCESCDNIIKYETRFQTCSTKCSKIKRENTCMSRYGVKNTIYSPERIEKSKQTCLRKYGTEYATQSSIVKSKIKKTNNERYGVDSPLQNKDIQQKTIDTVRERYGVDKPLQNKDIQQKTVETVRERYGVDNPLLDQEIHKKSKDTLEQRYGVRTPSQNPDLKRKQQETSIERYGYKTYLQTDECKQRTADKRAIKIKEMVTDLLGYTPTDEVLNKLSLSLYIDYNPEYLKSCIDYISNEQDVPIELIRDQFESVSAFYKIANKYGYEFDSVSVSSYEDIICSWLDEFGVEYIRSDRTVLKPKELDIYIPSHNLAIEFNGTYWRHSDMFKPKNYHQDKTNQCNDLGITLIHIYEYTFINKHQVYKNLLKAKLDLNDTIYARKCVIKEVESSEEREFLNQHHLQGYVASTNCYGLYYNDELVTLCSFGKTRFGKSEDIELLRNCSKPGTTVVGGLSKLIKHYKLTHGVESIVCYSDASISFNKGGDITQPNYKWVKNDLILSRYQTMKHKLHKVLGDKFDPTLTEVENMTVNRFYRIFDAGNYVSIL